MKKVLILGTGAWGTALANVLLENKHYVAMYGINKNEINDLKNKKNTNFFKNFKLDFKPNLVSDDLNTIFKINYDFVLLVVPSKAAYNLILKINKYIKNKPILINCIKGFDQKSCKPWSIALKKITNKFSYITSLAGPSFANEVIKKAFTIVNIISNNRQAANKVIDLFTNDYFLGKYCGDEEFAYYISALKNTVAIVMGLLSGLNYSINTKAAFFTIAIKEIFNALGNKSKNISTIIDFCGIGDLYLTCNDSQSRNFQFGMILSKYSSKEALAKINTTVEGLISLSEINKIIKIKKIKCPLFENLFNVIYKGQNAKKLVKNVLISLKC